MAAAVAVRVRELRHERGWSGDELAQRLTDAGMQIRRSALANLEGNQRRDIGLTELFTLAAVFCVPVASLLGEPLDQLALPSLPGAEPGATATVTEVIDWWAGVQYPIALYRSSNDPNEFEHAAQPFAAHRRHAALYERLISDYVARNDEEPGVDDPVVQEIARHRLHMREMGVAAKRESLWAPPEMNPIFADEVAAAEKQLAPEYPRTSSPTLEFAR